MNRLSLLFALFFVAGCSQLRVQVSIFDLKEFEKQEEFVEAVVATAEARVVPLLATGLDQTEADLSVQVQAYVNSLANEKPGAGHVMVPVQVEQKLASDIVAVFSDHFSVARTEYLKGVTLATEARQIPRYPGKGDHDRRGERFLEAKAAFERGDQAIWTLPGDFDAIEAHLKTRPPPTTSPVNPEAGSDDARSIAILLKEAGSSDKALRFLRTAKRTADQKVATLIGHAGVMNDPFASVVISAPDSFWRGTFNQTYGIGTFGNTDVAVKMDGIANFSLKGLRTDNSKMTPALFKGLQQSLQIAAAVSGFHLPPAAASPNASATNSDSTAAPGSVAASEFTNVETDQQNAELKVLRSKAAALNLLHAIVAERSTFPVISPAADTEGAKAARADALGRITTALNANDADLGMN